MLKLFTWIPCLAKHADGELKLAPFSHRRCERQPDCDSMSSAFPVVNLPLISGEIKRSSKKQMVARD